MSTVEAPVSTEVFRVKLIHSSEAYLCVAPPEATDLLEPESCVVVPTRNGAELATVLGSVREESELRGAELFQVTRVATVDDLEQYERNQDLSRDLLSSCRKRAEAMELDIKVVDVHLVFGGGKLIVYFTAENRVNFRGLVHELAEDVGLRTELQQLGMREETRVIGGAGVCGRVLCCNGVTDQRPRVSVRMAREQGLSLDAKRISGQCGRLLCCLSYEYEFYKEIRRSVPKEGKSVLYQGEKFRVVELNAVSQRARIRNEDGVTLGVGFSDFSFDDAARRWEVNSATA